MSCNCEITLKVPNCDESFGGSDSMSFEIQEPSYITPGSGSYVGVLTNLATSRKDLVDVQIDAPDGVLVTVREPNQTNQAIAAGVLYQLQVFEFNSDPGHNTPLDMEIELPVNSGTIITTKTLCIIFEP